MKAADSGSVVQTGPRRRILVSAFACSPRWGSEPEVGWRWVIQIARFHDVVLLTHASFEEHLTPALDAAGVSLQVHYLRPTSFGRHPHAELNSRLYYVWWQWHARRLVAALLAGEQVDLVHHLTWGTVRFPCFLGGLGVPLVMGPLGGGDSAPLRFYRDLPLSSQFFECLRSLTLLWVRVDPLARLGPKRSELVLCRTRQTLQLLPREVRGRATVVADVGAPSVDISQRPRVQPADLSKPSQAVKLLFAGRLLGLKGLSMALGAVAHLERAGFHAKLDIAGDGPLRGFLQRKIVRLGLEGRITLLGNLPRSELMNRYAQADLFLFPSLHDSGGTVVLEALSRGLPVICLDLGGPANFIDEHCGAVVSTQGRTRTQLEHDIAQAIVGILRQPGGLQRLSEGAAEQARLKSWDNLVYGAYSAIHRNLGWVPLAK